MDQSYTPEREPRSQKPAEVSPSYEARCFELLHIVIDGEATPEEVEFFNLHAKECMPVYETYQLDVAIKKVLCHKVKKKEVPVGLVDSIRSKIRETTV
ncbi:hypothetical protein SAMN05421823_102687 [Catalinimonas alkaloidigena]|uniref:Zinc-finger n=1 Tax=Catalinimonas alkaloidigena TaxID=1075417 RepID=A0A1G9BRJ3_9BACT|nr:hypothetical protein SAMN05421823_102687 [Catalinimonas alkaloidigena]